MSPGGGNARVRQGSQPRILYTPTNSFLHPTTRCGTIAASLPINHAFWQSKQAYSLRGHGEYVLPREETSVPGGRNGNPQEMEDTRLEGERRV